MRLLLLTVTISLLVSNAVQAQTNLATNPGFESGTGSWSHFVVGDIDLDGVVGFSDIPPLISLLSGGGGAYQLEADVNFDGFVGFLDIARFIELLSISNNGGDGVAIVQDETIEGDNAAVLDHDGGQPRSDGLSQLVKVVPGRSYVFSASVFFENAGGECHLLAQSESGASLASEPFPATMQVWEKAQVKFTVPSDEETVHLAVISNASTGLTYFDAVKLLEAGGGGNAGSNLIANEDFENDDNSWTLNSGEYDVAEKRFGDRSLKLEAVSGGISESTQTVSLLGRGFEGDQPIYTLSAHIKTTGTVVPVPDMTQDWNSLGNQFDIIPGRGAALKVGFYDSSGTLLRTIFSPFFFSKATNFTEREFSFLPPEGTTELIVSAMVSEGSFQANFDNVQLNAWEVPQGASNIQSVGLTEVEAPEAQTYVEAIPMLGLQDAIDSVTTPSDSDYGKLVWAGAGEYSHAEVLLYSTTHLKLHKDAILEKTSETGDSNWFGALVKSAEYGVPRTDVIVEGGTLDNNDGNQDFAGSAVAIFGDRVIVRNVNIPRYSRTPDPFDPLNPDDPNREFYFASAIYLMGHHTYVHNNFVSGPKAIFGHDGIHLWGGTHSHIMSNEVLAGDDGLGLFTSTVEVFPSSQEVIATFDRDISDVEAYNNIFDSVGSRCVGLGLAVPRGDSRLTSTVSKVRIRNFTGVCGGVHPLLQVLCVPARRINQNLVTPLQFPDAQVADILLENGDLEGYAFPQLGDIDPLHPASERGGPGYTGGSLEEDPRLPPRGMLVFTDDVGWVQNTRFENISVRRFEDADNGFGPFSAVIDVFKNGPANLQQPNENIVFGNCTIGQPASEGFNALLAYRIVGDSGEVELLGNNIILSPGGTFQQD